MDEYLKAKLDEWYNGEDNYTVLYFIRTFIEGQYHEYVLTLRTNEDIQMVRVFGQIKNLGISIDRKIPHSEILTAPAANGESARWKVSSI